MDGLLQHRQVLQAGRIIKKAFGDTAASAVRNFLLYWFWSLFAYSAVKRALGFGPVRSETRGLARKRRVVNLGAGEDLLDAPSAKAVLQLTSRLAGSIEKIFLPAHDGQGWCGFCSVCKRPLQVRVADPAASVRNVEVAPHARKRFAFLVCLWGSSKDYVLGALVLGFSIKRTKTKHSLVCLHTDDVPKEHLELLSLFWECRLVQHIEVAAAQRLSTDSRIEESRFFKVFTKLRALEQIDFEKVLVMDIDLLVMSSIDDLFELPAPAALKRGMNRGKWPYKHGDDLDGSTFFGGRNPGNEHSWGQGTGINAGVMLLAPNLADFLTMQEELVEPCHPGHVRGNGPEQDYLSRFFADRPWRHISVENNFQVHHMYNALQPLLEDAERLVVCRNFKTVRVVHFSGDSGVKPWTRCLKKDFGWPDRGQDEEYVQRFLADYHSYLLWVKKDKARWERMERSMFDDSGFKGFSLGDDGAIYYEDENGKAQKEPPQEAVTAVLDATRYFLKCWFDTLEDAMVCLQRDLVEDLLNASPNPGPEIPWHGVMPLVQELPGRESAPGQDAVQEEHQGMDPGERDPWQDSPDPWAGGKGEDGAQEENQGMDPGERDPQDPSDSWRGWTPINQEPKGEAAIRATMKGKSQWKPSGGAAIRAAMKGKSQGKPSGGAAIGASMKGKNQGKASGQMYPLWGYKAVDPFNHGRKGGKPQASNSKVQVQVECFASEQARGVVFSGFDWTDEESLKESCGLFAKDGTRAARLFLHNETFFQEQRKLADLQPRAIQAEEHARLLKNELIKQLGSEEDPELKKKVKEAVDERDKLDKEVAACSATVDQEISLFYNFVEGLDKGDTLLVAAIGLESEVLLKVLAPLQLKSVRKNAPVVAVAGILGERFEIHSGLHVATAVTFTPVQA